MGLGDKNDRNTPQQLPVTDIISVSCGRFYTIILTSNGCFGCGFNYYGQLGLGHRKNQKSLQKINLSNVILISCGDDFTMVLTSDGIYSWGNNEHGQLGLGDNRLRVMIPQKIDMPNLSIISINCGCDYTILLTKQGELFVCGDNGLGQLGLGHIQNQFVFQKLNMNEFILSVNCGKEHIIATTKSGKYYGWGWNLCGTLGLGDTIDRFEPTEIVIHISGAK